MASWLEDVDNQALVNKIYCDKIKVGTGCTELLSVERHAYEVVNVISQTHIFIRRIDVERLNKIDIECQDYTYYSNPRNSVRELVFKYNHWYDVERWVDDSGKKRRKSTKINVVLGLMDEFHDLRKYKRIE